jgi:importin subunit alpha-6/7
MEGIKNILAAGERLRDMPGSANTNTFSVMLEDAGGLDLLENLQSHQSEDVSSRAVEILSTYFEAATDDNDAAVPAIGGQGMYQFPSGAGGMENSGSEAEASFNFGGV